VTAVGKVLINGAGPGGLSAAIALARQGVEVDVAEVTPDRAVLGSELLLSSANLRSLRELGVVDEVVARGVPISSVQMRIPDDTLVAEIPIPSVVPELPASVGILRRALHDVLYDAAIAAGATIRHGVTIEHLSVDDDGGDVTLTASESARFDLVIGADGVQSRVRALAFPDAQSPQYVGQCVWRARVPRGGDPCLDLWIGTRSNTGLITVNNATSYLFCLVPYEVPPRLDPEQFPQLLREQLDEYEHGLVAWSRERLGSSADIHFSPMMWSVLPKPWNRGRALLIGDAAHATTPHIGYGAGLAIEDGVVLGQELAGTDDAREALARFSERRFERCRMVVEGGVQISRWQQSDDSFDADQGRITNEIWAALAEPA
jgi:2-polyprenyl-6-methoxyphenol hydroxylase-like FAD-dependent oxidoreductase